MPIYNANKRKGFLQPVYYQAKLCLDAENDITITLLMIKDWKHIMDDLLKTSG
jgi:hypothetical protein